MNNVEYTPVPLMDVEKVEPSLSDAELALLKRASRWVYFLCFLQLVMAVISLLCGGIFMMIVSAFFISTGIVGASKQRVKLLTVHFVYSLVLYIFSLVGVVLMILNCNECKWGIYLGGFLFVLLQAIGMRHSRILISLLRKKEGIASHCEKKSIENHLCEKEKKSCVVQNASSLTPQGMYSYPMMPIPAHQFVTMQMQPKSPQFFPVQSVQYPFSQQPVSIESIPQVQQQQMQQMNQPIGLYPVIYQQV